MTQNTKISRRGLLAGAAGIVLSGAFLRGQSHPSQNDGDDFTFALISDTHLGRGGEKPADQMRQAVDEINATRAELVICCGDLVNAGEVPGNEKHYPQWLEIAGKLKSPWHAIPGNHDPLAHFTKFI